MKMFFGVPSRAHIFRSVLSPGWTNQSWRSNPGSGWRNCCGISSRKGASEVSGMLQKSHFLM